jgi:glycolate oxidase FAD binding subunit
MAGQGTAAAAAIFGRLAEVLPGDRAVLWGAFDPALGDRLGRAIAPGTAPPAVVVTPETVAELATVVQVAAQNRWRILPCGAATKLAWGTPTTGVEVLVRCDRLTELVDWAVGDLTVTAAAGMTLATLQDKLATAGQFLPLDPAFPDTATLGGIVATADAGSWRHRYGGVRDLLLGLSFVRWDGAIAKAGGRVVKNVAGYDLMKLMTGSWGTLGIMSQLTFRTYALPETSTTLVIRGDLEKLEPLDQLARGLLASSLSPLAVDWLQEPGAIAIAVRFGSVAPSVTEQARRLQASATDLGLPWEAIALDREAAFWKTARSQRDTTQGGAAILKVGLLPTAIAALLAEADKLGAIAQIHASSGIGRIRLPVNDPAPAIAAIQTLRQRCQSSGGYLTVLAAPAAVKGAIAPWGTVGTGRDPMVQLKQQFDPHGLLSPGRFVV